MIKHDSRDNRYRNPFGAVAIGSDVILSLDHPPHASVSLVTHFNNEILEIPFSMSVTLHFIPKGQQSSSENTFYGAGVLWYYFKIDNYFYGNASDGLGGEGQVYDSTPIPFQITVYMPDTVPNWYSNGVVYQIFPDRFCRSENYHELFQNAVVSGGPNGVPKTLVEDWSEKPAYIKNTDGSIKEWTFSGGTLVGIQSKLDYMLGLGVTVIYLNPIFMARSNHRYDTADYLRIDPLLGNEEDFKNLCDSAHERGIRIILDGVFNHVGADSIYFNLFGNFTDKTMNYSRFSKKSSDFSKTSQDFCAVNEKSPYHDWFTFRDIDDEQPGSAIREGLRFDCWWGVSDLPAVNELIDSYKDFIYRSDNSVVRKWMRLGADGWRLDVADELPDEFIQGIRLAMLEENPDSILIGEVWEDASNKVSYGELRHYFTHRELQSTMHYPFRNAVINFIKGEMDAYAFSRQMKSIHENYPPANFYACLNLIGSHDSPRILTELSDEEEEISWLALSRLKAVTMIQFMMPGVPCIYYGDEAGLSGGADPDNRRNFPWGRENNEILEHYRFLGTLRKNYPQLTEDNFNIYALSEHVICICRGRLRLIVNRGVFEWETVTLPESEVSLTLPPLKTMVLLLS